MEDFEARAKKDAEMLRAQIAAGREAQKQRQKDYIQATGTMADLPKDLEWNTRRCLELIGAAGATAYVVDYWDGIVEDRFVGDTPFHWGLPKELERSYAGTMLENHILGGMTGHEYIRAVIGAWIEGHGQDGGYAFLPDQGVVFTPEYDEAEEDEPEGEVLFAYRASTLSDGPRVFVEWATSDWKFYGIEDATEGLLEQWQDDKGCLREIAESDFEPGDLTQCDQLHEWPEFEDKIRPALEHTWAEEDAGRNVEYHQSEFTPQAILFQMHGTSKRDSILKWLYGWHKTEGCALEGISADLLEEAWARFGGGR